MMRRTIVALAVSAAVLTLLPAAKGYAQTSDLEKRILVDVNRRKLSGWAKLAFYCDRGSKQSAEIKLCDQIAVNARFLAAAARIPLTIYKDFNEIFYDPDYPNVLVLNVEITSTKPGPPSATYFRLSAVGYIPRNLIAKTAPDVWNDRAGMASLHFWTRDAIGASSSDSSELVGPLSNAFEQLFKTFLSDYMEANEKQRN